MTIISNFLIATESILSEALILYNSNKSYSDKLNELNNVIAKINDVLAKNSEEISFTENDKNKIKIISNQIRELESKNNASLDFFVSLSKHFEDKVNLKNKY